MTAAGSLDLIRAFAEVPDDCLCAEMHGGEARPERRGPPAGSVPRSRPAGGAPLRCVDDAGSAWHVIDGEGRVAHDVVTADGERSTVAQTDGGRYRE
jgi:hypothetical protein